VRRTSAYLADGREIIYFDRDGGPVRDAVDLRPLKPTESAAEVRWDVLLGEPVAIASHRQDRTYLPPADECPLCPSRGGRHTEIPSPDYDVVVFENRFPAFTERAPGGRGRCEVVCFTSDHDRSFRELTPERVRTVLDVWADRTEALSRLDGVRWVYPFENRGAEIGVTLAHPHGQIYAYPYLPPTPARMLEQARRHHESTGANLFAEVLCAERAGPRVIASGEHWTAFVPVAARWPVEVHLYPHRRVPDIPALTADERDDFARVYLDVLARFDALYAVAMPYVAAWHQAPVASTDGIDPHGGTDRHGTDRDLAYLHLRLCSIRRAPGKLKYLAGSELGAGAFLNDVAPEAIAERLRGALG
jgi:UDPglucose--hexose-1-phosphate uridylyltransferase